LAAVVLYAVDFVLSSADQLHSWICERIDFERSG
jgi:hypothetical protein